MDRPLPNIEPPKPPPNANDDGSDAAARLALKNGSGASNTAPNIDDGAPPRTPPDAKCAKSSPNTLANISNGSLNTLEGALDALLELIVDS